MANKILFVDTSGNIGVREVTNENDFAKLLEGEIEKICIKPIARSICIAVGDGVDVYDPYKGFKVVNGHNYLVYIVENTEGKGIEEAKMLSMTEKEQEYFYRFKEKILQ